VLSVLEMVFLLSGIIGLGLLALAFRWRPRITRDGFIFLMASVMAIRGIVDARPDLFGAGFAGLGLVPVVRGTLDKARDSASRSGAP
jgi:hypothetical protein